MRTEREHRLLWFWWWSEVYLNYGAHVDAGTEWCAWCSLRAGKIRACKKVVVRFNQDHPEERVVRKSKYDRGEGEKTVKRILELIKKHCACLVVVEGVQDVASMRAVGFECVLALNKRPLYLVVEDIVSQAKEAIILTDFDAEGVELHRVLRHYCSQHGVFLRDEVRLAIKALGVRCMEDVAKHVLPATHSTH